MFRPHRFWRMAMALVVVGVSGGLVAAASGAQAPTPILTRSVVLTRTGGTVSYERPGSSNFVALASAAVLVPVGTTVNAGAGVVRVTIAGVAPGTTASALFYTGQFSVAQKATGIATLALNGPLAPCAPSGATGSSGATGATKGLLERATKKRPSALPKARSLWGDGGSGSFTTEGHFAAATVIGTVWLTTDSCTSTVVSVAEGHVSVRNLVSNSTVTVSTGQALTVQSTGTTASAPFTGPTSPPSYPNSTGPTPPTSTGHALTITSDHSTVALGEDYSLTATGTAAAGATAYIYENVGAPCSTTLAGERANGVASEFTDKTLTAAGAFTLVAQALAQHTGTKYYCAYLTDPASYAQVIVTVGSSSSTSSPVHATSANGAITLSSTASAPTLGTSYTLTLTGKAASAGTADIYENTGSVECAPTLSGERQTSDAFLGPSKSVAAGSFTLTASAVASHTGTKYYCGYLTDPASEVQVIVTVSSS